MGSSIVIDLGASWIHGIGPGAGDLDEWEDENNPIWDLVQEYEINTVKTWSDEDDAQSAFFWFNGT